MGIHVLMARIATMEGDAATLRDWGAEVQADALTRACNQFRTIIREWLDEPLSIGQAAAEYPRWKERTIAEHIRQGVLPQAGTQGGPLVRRGDLFGFTDDVPEEYADWAEDLIDG